ncbi:MAG: class I SAM-dependent methyltransferase [Myxococcales bacterium]|nr:class I SAM-dependent methyltransferase [Myxococcales bacterium]
MKPTLRWILTGVLLVLPRLAAADKAPPPRAHHHDGPPGAHAGADKPMVHRFENPADWTAKFDGPERDAWQKPQELVKRLQIAPGMTVADIGAGTGYLMPHLAAATGDKGRVIAVDIEPKMVQHLTDRAKKAKLSQVTAQLGEPGDPKLAAASVDKIVFLDTWHHVPSRMAYAQKLLAALRPGGSVYIVDFTMDSSQGPPKKHRLTPDAVMLDLHAAGFVAELLSEELPEQYIVVGKKAAP